MPFTLTFDRYSATQKKNTVLGKNLLYRHLSLIGLDEKTQILEKRKKGWNFALN